ncbi:MAG: enoyl-CoA hydratase/isomerase family protein [Chloroflexi bacterium]|nr:enoyl-CoA hydratase/isomerase family protein [Chloroflexota bacterium]MDA1145172.1 enoyl-CoA hydratase/isomerase family protein [Chloroflexota bacterium]
MADEVIWEQNGHVATIRLNRPEALNAMNSAVRDGLMAALHRVRDDDSVRSAVLTGTGRAFSAGADLKERARGDSDRSGGPETVLHGLPQAFYTFDPGKPIIAAINGLALGGGLELTLACDIRIAVNTAMLGTPEITRGFFPGGGAPLRLPRLIPRSMAMEMLLTGDPIDAATALQWGLVSRVVTADELMPTALKLAGRIAEHAPLAVRANRELAYATDDMTMEQVLRMSSLSRWVVGQTEDAAEGPRAFVEKRAPEYHGR